MGLCRSGDGCVRTRVCDCSGYKWHLVYSLAKHGATLDMLLKKCTNVHNTMVILKDNHGYVFGSFSADGWKPCSSYYGSGRSCVFSFHTSDKHDVSKFKYGACFPHNGCICGHSRVEWRVVRGWMWFVVLALVSSPTVTRVYKWTRENKFFQVSGLESMAVGGGGGFALYLVRTHRDGNLADRVLRLVPWLVCLLPRRDRTRTCSVALVLPAQPTVTLV